MGREQLRCLLATMFLSLLAYGCGMIEQLGQDPSPEDQKVLARQPNYKDGAFVNLNYPDDTAHTIKRGKILRSMVSKPDSVTPPHQLPWVRTDLKALTADKPVVVWFGHSSVLIKAKGANILIDPIFSNHAGPVPGMVKAFKGANHYDVKDMPPIDIVIISHDHYDHLDYRTLKKLRKQVKKVVVPMGVGSHLKHWGYASAQIVELNWDQSFRYDSNISITATPARHRSNRTFKSNRTLWASYVIGLGGHRIFYSGDGGYGHHFARIGKQYGPFDLALMECGQYSPNWPRYHMHPTQTAQAAADLKAKAMLPVHWAKFAESTHTWNDPVRQLLPAAKKLGIEVCTPRLGESYTIGDTPRTFKWWTR